MTASVSAAETKACRGAELIDIGGGWTAEIYREWEFPGEVTSWWQAASGRQGDNGLFTSPGWLRACWSGWGKPGTLFVILLRQNGRMTGIIPAHTGKTDFGDPGIICSLPGNPIPYDFLTQGDPEAVVAGLVRLFETRLSGFYLQCDCLPEATAHLVAQRFRARGFSAWGHSAEMSPFIRLDGTAAAYLRSLDSKVRKELERCRRRIAADSELQWEIHRNPDDLQGLLTEAFDIEARSWKGQVGTAVTQVPAFERFLRLASEWAASEDKLHLRALRHRGQMIAFLLCFIEGGTVFAYEQSFDKESPIRVYAPGSIALLETMEPLFQDPVFSRFSLLGAPSPFKARWSSEYEVRRWVTIYPRTLAGRAKYCLRHGWKETLRRSDAIRTLMDRIRPPGGQK